MGTDIHLYAEVKVDDRWRPALPMVTSRYDDQLHYPDLDPGRNYDLFAILGNVRNGHGVAGIKTGEGFAWLTDCRGLPNDMCDEYNEMCNNYDFGDHSYSWCTLAEILTYDWTQVTTKRCVVGLVEYARLQRVKDYDPWPTDYSGAVSGGNTRNIGAVAADGLLRIIQGEGDRLSDEMIMAYETTHETWYYVEYSWSASYSRCCRSFWSNTVPRLLRMGDPADVRLVFGFDS